MARKAIVDKDIILEKLKQGETTQRIAESYGVSRQAIDLHRKDFISRGLLEDKRAARKKKDEYRSTSQSVSREGKQPELIREAPRKTIDTMTLNDQIDLLISAFSALKRVSQLEQDLTTYKRENERIARELSRLRELERKRIEQENRWMLIQNDSADIGNN